MLPSVPAPAPERIPGLRTGAEIADFLGPLVAAVPPEEAVPFLMPAAVLTIAGLKGLSYIPDLGDLSDVVKHVNGACRDRLIRFKWDAGNGGTLIIQSLAGAERASRGSKLPGALRFENRLGFDGYGSHREEQLASFARKVASGSYPHGCDPADLEHGVAYGYPDRAIIDFERVHTTRSEELAETMQLTDIEGRAAGSQLEFRSYDEGGADIWVQAHHAADRDVCAYVEAALFTLRGFAETTLAKRFAEDLTTEAVLERRMIAQTTRRGVHRILGSFDDSFLW